MSQRPWMSNLCITLAVLAAPLTAPAADQVTGPYKHANLSIYLIHGDGKGTSSKLITLQEAMDSNKTVVYETGSVNELSIENKSGEEVFIQSGDIVKGGRQDRVLTTDLILPPHSGKIPITAFCVEQGRWTKRGSESAEQFGSSNAVVAGKSLKTAVRGDARNQQEVWQKVAEERQNLSMAVQPASPTGARSESRGIAAARAGNTTSMQMALEDKGVVNAIEGYTKDLEPMAARDKTVIGYAYAVNGKLSSAEVYESHDLFLKMWSKLLRSSAAEAVADPAKSGASPSDPEISAVNDLLSAADGAPVASKQTNGKLTVIKKESPNTLLFETREQNPEGAWMHRSYVVK